MRILVTVCGRAGSQGVKGKNVKEFNGHPLVLYTLSAIELLMKQLDGRIDVAMNTDSTELMQLSSKLPNCKIIERESSLAGNDVGKISVIRDTYIKMKKLNNCEYDAVLDLDITSPIRTVNDIMLVINQKVNNKNLDVVFSVVKSRRSPYFNMVKKEYGDTVKLVQTAKYTARQQVPQTYDMNASIYAFDPEFLMKNVHIFDGECGMVEMSDTLVLDIDGEEDFIWMEYIYIKLLASDPEIRAIYENISNLN